MTLLSRFGAFKKAGVNISICLSMRLVPSSGIEPDRPKIGTSVALPVLRATFRTTHFTIGISLSPFGCIRSVKMQTRCTTKVKGRFKSLMVAIARDHRMRPRQISRLVWNWVRSTFTHSFQPWWLNLFLMGASVDNSNRRPCGTRTHLHQLPYYYAPFIRWKGYRPVKVNCAVEP